ncbi:hypothetical protein Bca101_026068 [Brassica carinata]
MDGFVTCKDQKEKGKSEKHKGKNIAVDNVAAEGKDFSDDVLRDYLNSGEPVDLDEFFDFDHPADDVSNEEIARLKGELEQSHFRGREPSEAEIRCADRRGKNEVAEIVRARREKFSHYFGELQASHKALGEYRECRGTAGGLYLTTAHDYSYDVEYER